MRRGERQEEGMLAATHVAAGPKTISIDVTGVNRGGLLAPILTPVRNHLPTFLAFGAVVAARIQKTRRRTRPGLRR
jgi:hypothetical protein